MKIPVRLDRIETGTYTLNYGTILWNDFLTCIYWQFCENNLSLWRALCSYANEFQCNSNLVIRLVIHDQTTKIWTQKYCSCKEQLVKCLPWLRAISAARTGRPIWISAWTTLAQVGTSKSIQAMNISLLQSSVLPLLLSCISSSLGSGTSRCKPSLRQSVTDCNSFRRSRKPTEMVNLRKMYGLIDTLQCWQSQWYQYIILEYQYIKIWYRLL